MPFGRHAGRTLEEIAETDLDYLRWLLREEVGSDELRAEAARLLEEHTYVPGPGITRMGRLPAWAWGLAGAVAGALLIIIAGQLMGQRPGGPQPPPPTPVIAAVGPQRSRVASREPLAVSPPPAVTSTSTTALISPTPPSPTNSATSAGSPDCEDRPEGVLAPDEVNDHLGEYRSVQFRVVRTYNSGKAVFLNSHDPWQGYFEVVIFPEHWEDFPQPPEDLFRSRCIVVYGKLRIYKGTPEIVLQSADHIHVVE